MAASNDGRKGKAEKKKDEEETEQHHEHMSNGRRIQTDDPKQEDPDEYQDGLHNTKWKRMWEAVKLVNGTIAFFGKKKRKLGYVLEKMHAGDVLSQHEVSGALREYNQLCIELEHLQRRIEEVEANRKKKVQTPPPRDKFSKGTETNPDVMVLFREDYDKLLERITHRDSQIDELNRRLRNLVVSKPKESSTVIPNLSTLPEPVQLVDEFCDLYSNEWATCFETLKTSWNDQERAIYTLFRVIRHAYVFCYDVAEDQRHSVEGLIKNLEETMFHPTFTHPVNRNKYKAASVMSERAVKARDFGRKLFREYRRLLVKETVPGIQDLFRKVKQPEIFETGFVTPVLQTFIDKAVELIWLMVVQDPPMMAYWLEDGRPHLPGYFNFFSKRGDTVKQTVWPAVFLYEDGALLSKGVILVR
ncbi:hypothetical protein CHS0354_026389 [Potamilus streckersoni]|uniref:Mitochondria-eating protein C-terminal domain-containing protein n=1 Tax=Potamilus streckersoni TaxID=2493646 RepID=A0AAE0W6F8_9BIVA|nr:hypothetical protein CHS0354_026389 [Potamilus streckersoni]